MRRAIVLLGPPGSGKGTQAHRLGADLKYPAISTGDILRDALRNQTELGKRAEAVMQAGELVPDALVDEIVKSRLMQPDCGEGFILDGYPRTTGQARFLEELLAKEKARTLVIGLRVEDEVLVNRIAGRWSCPGCGKVFRAGSLPSRGENRCDECNTVLANRKDDSAQVLEERLKVYRASTEPLIQFYESCGCYVEVDGEGSIDEIYNSILAIIGGRQQNRNVTNC